MPFSEPSSIHAADICRDGGTLVLVYLDRSGLQHEVEVPVRVDENYEVVGYWPPSLKTCSTKVLTALDWEEAASLGMALSSLIRGEIEWGGPERARQVVDVLSLGGRLQPKA